jgi:hypothetical protein
MLEEAYKYETKKASADPADGGSPGAIQALPSLKMVLVHIKDDQWTVGAQSLARSANTKEASEAEEAALRLIMRLIQHFDKQT